MKTKGQQQLKQALHGMKRQSSRKSLRFLSSKAAQLGWSELRGKLKLSDVSQSHNKVRQSSFNTKRRSRASTVPVVAQVPMPIPPLLMTTLKLNLYKCTVKPFVPWIDLSVKPVVTINRHPLLPSWSLTVTPIVLRGNHGWRLSAKNTQAPSMSQPHKAFSNVQSACVEQQFSTRLVKTTLTHVIEQVECSVRRFCSPAVNGVYVSAKQGECARRAFHTSFLLRQSSLGTGELNNDKKQTMSYRKIKEKSF